MAEIKCSVESALFSAPTADAKVDPKKAQKPSARDQITKTMGELRSIEFGDKRCVVPPRPDSLATLELLLSVNLGITLGSLAYISFMIDRRDPAAMIVVALVSLTKRTVCLSVPCGGVLYATAHDNDDESTVRLRATYSFRHAASPEYAAAKKMIEDWLSAK